MCEIKPKLWEEIKVELDEKERDWQAYMELEKQRIKKKEKTKRFK